MGNPVKMNLGMGAYRDDAGQPFVLPSILKAELSIVEKRMNKEYAPIGGEGEFCQEAAKLAFGADSFVVKEGLNVTVQGISGTGSLRIGAEFISKHFPLNRQSTCQSPAGVTILPFSSTLASTWRATPTTTPRPVALTL